MRGVKGTITHGASGYSNQGCKCEVCTAGNRDYHRSYMARTGRVLPRAAYLRIVRAFPPPHGTESRYARPHYCRCDDCRAAATEARRNRRHDATVD